MAQDWAKRFYTSSAWRKLRDYVLKRDDYLCARCGAPGKIVHHKVKLTPLNINDPFVSLNADNLETLCQDCHNAEHEGRFAMAPGLAFDENGNLIKR